MREKVREILTARESKSFQQPLQLSLTDMTGTNDPVHKQGCVFLVPIESAYLNQVRVNYISIFHSDILLY